MSKKEYQYNRYGERDVRPGHFQHGGGLGSLFHGHDSRPYISMPSYQDEYGMNREEGDMDWSHDPRSEASSENHRGKGPKGWSRSDDRIFDEACEVLYRSWTVDASDIQVEVNEGIIHLKGTVEDRDQKRQAEREVERLEGVKDVQNELKIKKVSGWVPGLGNVTVNESETDQ